jgi:hypothetical protein
MEIVTFVAKNLKADLPVHQTSFPFDFFFWGYMKELVCQ